MNIENLRDTITPKSDQLNADDLVGTSMTITVTGVSRGAPDQPIEVHYEGGQGRPYKPCKTMRRVLIFAWGDDGREWAGRSMTLYNDPEVKWGGVKVGGIRISHLSHIKSALSMSITETKGKKKPYLVNMLQAQHMQAVGRGKRDPLPALKEKLNAAAQLGMKSLGETWGTIPNPLKPELTAHKDALKAVAAKFDAAGAGELKGFAPGDPAPQQEQQTQPEPEPQQQEPEPPAGIEDF